ncbi:MAG: SPOR domain-containing protein [Hyphomicrobium sp.]|nr:SPOR domain-containing protein [Hyphomicrobium sp.]
MAADRFPLSTALVLAALSMSNPAAAQTVAKPAVAEKAANPKAAEAAKAYAAGTKAFEGGKTDAAVAALSTAITMGGLSNPDLAKAMFYRGVAYRKQKMPAAALSDLNAAVWLRDGLSATDRAVAEDHRQALLREVAALKGVAAAAPVETAFTPAPSVPEPPTTAPEASRTVAEPQAQALPWATAEVTPPPAPDVKTVEAPKAIEAAEAPQPPPVVPKAAPAPVTIEEDRTASVAVGSAPSQDADMISEPVATVAPVERDAIGTVQAEAAPPEKPLPWQMASSAAQGDAPSAPAQAALPWSTSAVAPVVSVAAVAPEPSPAPAASVATAFTADASKPAEVPSALTGAPAALADAGKAAGAFLGNLFSGGSTVSEPASSPPPANESAPLAATKIETAALPEPPRSVEPASVTWPIETKVAPVVEVQPFKAPEVKIAAAEPVAPENAPPGAAVLPGPYRLHIAAENSRADAEQTLSRLLSAHRPSLRGLEPVIEEPATGGVLFGSMGAAYRVSVGPYASSMEPGRLCNILRPHGFDCRVVTISP